MEVWGRAGGKGGREGEELVDGRRSLKKIAWERDIHYCDGPVDSHESIYDKQANRQLPPHPQLAWPGGENKAVGQRTLSGQHYCCPGHPRYGPQDFPALYYTHLDFPTRSTTPAGLPRALLRRWTSPRATTPAWTSLRSTTPAWTSPCATTPAGLPALY